MGMVVLRDGTERSGSCNQSGDTRPQEITAFHCLDKTAERLSFATLLFFGGATFNKQATSKGFGSDSFAGPDR
jgi:hypothetical protein